MHWGFSKVGPAAPPSYIVSVNAFPEHLTGGSYPGRWSQLNSDLTHDWSPSLKILIRVSSQHSGHCTLSPRVYAHQLSLSAMIWASEFLINWRHNRISCWPIGVTSLCCHVSKWRAYQMPNKRVCHGVGQKSHKNEMAYFVSEISEGLWLIEIAFAKCKKKKYYTVHSPTLMWIVIVYLVGVIEGCFVDRDLNL